MRPTKHSPAGTLGMRAKICPTIVRCQWRVRRGDRRGSRSDFVSPASAANCRLGNSLTWRQTRFLPRSFVLRSVLLCWKGTRDAGIRPRLSPAAVHIAIPGSPLMNESDPPSLLPHPKGIHTGRKASKSHSTIGPDIRTVDFVHSTPCIRCKTGPVPG